MDCSEARLDKIESQSSTESSQDQRRQGCFSMNKINNGFRTLSSRGFLRARGKAKDTESVPEYLINLRWSDLFDLPGEYVVMNAVMLSTLSDGNEEWLEKMRSLGTPLACLKNNRGDSVLHLAATWSHLELVKSIVSEWPCLLLEANSKDQLPLHLAARVGHSAVVEALVASVTFFSDKLVEEDRERLNPYVLKDINGDTALNLALKRRYMEVALFLVKANQQASFLASKDGISPLYLAVEAGDLSLVKAMLGNNGTEGTNFNLEGRKYLAHAALKSMSTDVLEVILNKYPSVVDERDEKGRTCLMFGASMGYYKGVCKLLERSTESVFVCDDDGSYPIHMAVENSHIEVVIAMLQRCPYSKHLLNRKGQNILHIAAESGNLSILDHLTTCESTYYHLSNEQDVDGNTPLHLATIKWRPRAIHCLAGKKNLLTQNNKGLTALNIADVNLQPHYIFRERLTLMALADAQFKNYPTFRDTPHTMGLTRPIKPKDGGNKDYINALLVVAALIATVTFTAGFTIPGGVRSSNPNLGMANLAAMLCLYLAIYFMSFAFFFAMVIVAGNATWLLSIYIYLTIPTLMLMLSTFIPHALLHRSGFRSRLLWFLVYLGNSIDDGGNQRRPLREVLWRYYISKFGPNVTNYR
ncbi:protein ACCELERATED CELL DEATH 6 isoform X2 [Capsella rubella]|uniref:protein ACCELERATED CELL DEATH 6 isoform X2 n=1 Tax=Capsella rubella TaxID=81985 RepID=UPI000CD4B19A|nr:protein ACCELERATED CELL DEATH 6 isoform X2 [Capsella rubella]